MSNAFGFGSSSNRSEVEVKCHHQIDSKLRMVKSGSNLGKKFYGCSLWLVSGQNQTWVTNIGCLSIASMILFLFFPEIADFDFFRWVEDVGKTNVSEWEKLEGKLLEKVTVVAQLEEEKKILEEKKLKVENEKRHTAGGHGRHEKRVVLAAWCYVQV